VYIQEQRDMEFAGSYLLLRGTHPALLRKRMSGKLLHL